MFLTGVLSYNIFIGRKRLVIDLSIKREIREESECVSVTSQVIYSGRTMRASRLKAGIGSQKELADMTGIAPNIISDLERGQREMSPNWEKRITEAFGVYSTDFQK